MHVRSARSRATLRTLGRSLVAAVLLAVAPIAGLLQPAASAPRPAFDAALEQRAPAAALAELDRLARDPVLSRIGQPEHVDERFGVPSFLIATPGATRPAAGATVEQAARTDLLRLAPYYRLAAEDVQDAPLRYISDTGVGGIVAAFQQEVDGVPVFREEMKVLLDRQHNLVAVSGSIPARASALSHDFRLGLTDAVAGALSDLTGTAISAATPRHLASQEGGYETFDAPGAVAAKLSPEPIRARRVFFRLGEALVPAYYVELSAQDEAPAYVLAADDGRVLFRCDHLAYDSFNYRVWADASGLLQPLDGPQGTSATPYPTTMPSLYSPPMVAQSLVGLQNGPISTNDPWLAPGATTTDGQNVRAYLNAGPTFATITSAGTFDRMYDMSQPPDTSSNQQLAGVTQVFYTLNFLHDWFYDAGFTESARNAQLSNYGRGGAQNDPIIAKTQISVDDNASMQTPADGGSPVLSSYLWTLGTVKQVLVNSPAAVKGQPACGAASSNAASFSVTADIALPFPGTFSATGSTITAGSSPRLAQISDVNGDGWPDLIVSNSSSNNVGVMLNNGAGGFAAQVTYATGNAPRMTVTPDLNHDGLPDLVSANTVGGNITIRLGTGGGAFGASTALTSASGANSIAVGRFNGDANDDVVVGNAASNNVSVFLGDGAGSFAPRVLYPMGSSPTSVAVGDLNGDGNADLAAVNFGAGNIFMSIRLGTGTGTFGAVITDTIGNSPQGLALSDLNGDGKLDAIAANTGNSTVSVALGNGDGTFGTPVFYALPSAPISVTAADFNGDGIVDVIASSGTVSGVVSLLANNGAGVLGTPQNFAVGNTPAGITVGDVNGDGNPDVLAANSGSGNVTLLTGTVTPSTSNCPPFANTLTGRIALFSAFAGGCGTPDDRITEAEARGAVGALMEYSQALAYGASTAHGIPAFIIVDTTGQTLRTALKTGAVNATLITGASLLRDGALDNAVVAHEWGHSLSNRLIGNANGLYTNQAGGMGEGWSDFVSLLMTVRPEDAAAPSNANWTGTFAAGGFAFSNSLVPTNRWYFGVRRYPYSTDFARNPLTFQHIMNGVPLPVGPPEQLTGGSNAEVHNTGEVWCNMLWECYASLLRDSGRLTFTQARDRMRRYLVQSLQLTPVTPTFVEARDAMLMAAHATDAADYQLFRAAFARRGLGTGAVAPARTSTDNSGVVESFVVGGEQRFVSLTIDDSLTSCDHDGILDAGEDGYVTLKLWSPITSTDLSGGTATFTSPNPNLQFPLGNSVAIPSSQPLDTTRTRVRVHAIGSGIQLDSLYVQYDNANWATPGARSAAASAWGNVDLVTGTSEGFEGPSASSWTPVTLDPWGPSLSAPWAVVKPDPDSSNHVILCPILGDDSYHNTDNYIRSPAMVVGPDNFSFTFKSAYEFATDPDGLCGCNDGGVVEISADGGSTWADVGAANITPSYNHTMSKFVLKNRQIFGGTSAGYPAWVPTTVNLGTTYAGKTVRIRFYAEGDAHGTAPGWMIDDVAFTGITNAPFITLSAETGTCGVAGADDGPPSALAFAIEGENPGRGRPSFRFALPTATHVHIAIYDVAGRRMATIADGAYAAGVYRAGWKDSEAPKAGVYFARMTVDGQTLDRRIVVVH